MKRPPPSISAGHLTRSPVGSYGDAGIWPTKKLTNVHFFTPCVSDVNKMSARDFEPLRSVGQSFQRKGEGEEAEEEGGEGGIGDDVRIITIVIIIVIATHIGQLL